MSKEKTETQGSVEQTDTECFTYEVVMLVQVLAPSREMADAQLDSQGGYVSKRTVNFVRSVVIHDSAQEDLFGQVEKPDQK